MATAHDTVVDAQEDLRESNFALESSLRAIEKATDDLAAAEAERERQRIERQRDKEQEQAEANAGLGYDGADYPTGADNTFGAGIIPSGGNTYQTATHSSEVSINVNVGAMKSSEDARRYAVEFAEEAVRELKKRGVNM